MCTKKSFAMTETAENRPPYRFCLLCEIPRKQEYKALLQYEKNVLMLNYFN